MPRAPRILRTLVSRGVMYDGTSLPPPGLRYCGARFRNDEFFIRSADDEARRLVALGLTPRSHVLEIGCGPGRLPIGIIRVVGAIDEYRGIDIDRASIEWCRHHIHRHHPTFSFDVVKAQHDRYQPNGPIMDDSFRLPVADGSFDFIYMHSVIANMIERDVQVYARTLRRAIAPKGLLFLTAFVEDDVPPITINPEDYVVESAGTLTVARYERTHLLAIFEEAGFALERFDHAAELDGQSGIHLRPTPR